MMENEHSAGAEVRSRRAGGLMMDFGAAFTRNPRARFNGRPVLNARHDSSELLGSHYYESDPEQEEVGDYRERSRLQSSGKAVLLSKGSHSGLHFVSDFASPSTLEASGTLLNQSLHSLGMNFEMNFTSSTPEDIAAVMNCVYSLLQHHTQDLRHIDGVNEQFSRLETDLKRLGDQKMALKNELLQKDHAIVELENRLQTKVESFKEEVKNLKVEKKRLEKECIRLQHVDTGYKATLRKRETEYEKLKKRYNDYLTKSTVDKKRGLNMTTKVTSLHKDKNQSLGGDAERDLAATIVASYEAKECELLSENSQLRSSLKMLQDELKKLTAQYNQTAKWLKSKNNVFAQYNDENANPAAEITCSSVKAGAFSMPVEWMKDNVEKQLHAKMEVLKQKMAELGTDGADLDKDATQAPGKESSTLISNLKRNLQEAMSIISEQDKLLNHSLIDKLQRSGLEKGGATHQPEMSEIEDMVTALEEERRQIEKSRENFEQERQAFYHTAGMSSWSVQNADQEPSTPLNRTDKKSRLRSLSSEFLFSPELPVPATPATARLLHQMGFMNVPIAD